MQNDSPLLNLDHISVSSLDKILFTDLTFKVNKGENWALVGESGSGKSALLATLAGNFNITSGNVDHGFYKQFIKDNAIDDPFFNYHKLITLVNQKHSFKNLSNTSEFYYQQRYNSFDSEDALTVKSYLSSIKSHDLGKSIWTFDYIVSTLRLENLLEKQVIKLSNGETRRLLFAAALLKHPQVLLLDSPFTGLDVNTRPYFHQLIAEIITSGITVIMATSPKEIPDAITHVAILHDGKIVGSMPYHQFSPAMVKIPEISSLDREELNDLLALKPLEEYNWIVKMENVSIKYGDNQILDHVNWDIKQGESWALMGANGAGKSTLLSLINGDNPQAYANYIVLFDRKRGSGESIWDIKRKTGFVSPEMLQYFTTESSCLQVVESGFYDTMGLFRPSSKTYADIAFRWMKLMGIDDSKNVLFKKVSASTQRLCLLARALVKNPPLLILDEPCQGLDLQQQMHFKQIVDSISELSKTTLIYVTHYQDELPNCVNHVLRLDKGKVVVN